MALTMIASFHLLGQSRDSVIWTMGEVLDIDSPNTHSAKTSRSGYENYFAIQHIKIKTYRNDTLLVARVINLMEELEDYSRSFEIEKSKSYVFILSPFTPCKSDFPMLAGYCDDDLFYPKLTKMATAYHSIPRVIKSTPTSGTDK